MSYLSIWCSYLKHEIHQFKKVGNTKPLADVHKIFSNQFLRDNVIYLNNAIIYCIITYKRHFATITQAFHSRRLHVCNCYQHHHYCHQRCHMDQVEFVLSCSCSTGSLANSLFNSGSDIDLPGGAWNLVTALSRMRSFNHFIFNFRVLAFRGWLMGSSTTPGRRYVSSTPSSSKWSLSFLDCLWSVTKIDGGDGIGLSNW